ncbi:ABC transporter substrate-binding protein [Streptomyces sp. A7024]|uniref:ABC transporter substrate-binding protein n=1 Tax=Streptomyces coryli TaxID=1128680 RepID=A0A6G4U3K1_9ACTN|nr:ABC transporter substrate-binding protein [Streptomyces coryli]NGN66582.1 ABC transporter substrate-binding protein [Streptomyces coryli]
MTVDAAWRFGDDTGVMVEAVRRPERVVAYLRAGASLWDLGVTPAAVYGSGHDGRELDPVKAGRIAGGQVPYVGPGGDLDAEWFAAERPDLIVDVTYDGKGTYAIDSDAARRLGVPVVALAVGGGVPLRTILSRFADLAAALGATPRDPEGERKLEAAEQALRGPAGRRSARVLALSGADAEQVYLARPETWPDLRHLTELGLDLLDPEPDAGRNWATTTWTAAADLRPDVVLYDSRRHAAPVPDTVAPTRLPWNPEEACSPVAYAGFLRRLAVALGD